MTGGAAADERHLLHIVSTHAMQADADGLPRVIGDALGDSLLLAPMIPQRHGGRGWSHERFGAWCAELGAVCASSRSLVTVQSMVASTVERWGTEAQRSSVLPCLASGQLRAAFCLSEPDVGCDGAAVGAELVDADGGGAVTGTKVWVTFGAVATLLLVITSTPGGPVGVLVECDADGPDGLTRDRIVQPLGLRGAWLAHLRFDAVAVQDDALLGPPGFGFTHVAQTALDIGRLSVAWGCVGMVDACLDASAAHTRTRVQFGRPIAEHQLIRRRLAELAVDARAARALCTEASRAHDQRAVDAMRTTIAAKHLAAARATDAALTALQIHGAAACTPGSIVERMYRDAAVMRIIEGTDEMNELVLSSHVLSSSAAGGRAT